MPKCPGLEASPEGGEPFRPNRGELLKPNRGKPLKPNEGEPSKLNRDEPLKPNRDEPLMLNRGEPFKPKRSEPFKPNRGEPLKPNRGAPFRRWGQSIYAVIFFSEKRGFCHPLEDIKNHRKNFFEHLSIVAPVKGWLYLPVSYTCTQNTGMKPVHQSSCNVSFSSLKKFQLCWAATNLIQLSPLGTFTHAYVAGSMSLREPRVGLICDISPLIRTVEKKRNV